MNNLQTKKQKKFVKKGDVVFLGPHVLGCGDSRDSAFVADVLSDKHVSLICTDPPYGVALVESAQGFKTLMKNKVIQADHVQSDEEYRAFSQGWIKAIKPHLTQKNAFYIFNSDKMIWSLHEAILAEECKFAQLLIWLKTSAVIGRLDYAPQHELIAYGWFGTHAFHKPKDKSVLICPKPTRSPHHPSTKPISLIRRLILNSTSCNEVVFDGFLGSGTTLFACEQTKRVCVGIEIDEEYCQGLIERWEKLNGKSVEYKNNDAP